jgi:hypothetical protein
MGTLWVAVHFAGPVRWETGGLSWRKRHYIAPGILILLCIWAFWAVFLPWLNLARERSTRAIDATNLNGIGKAMLLYAAEHGDCPDHLDRLIEEGQGWKLFTMPSVGELARVPDYEDGKPFHAPEWLHYIRPSEEAPDDLICVWPDPVLYHAEDKIVLLNNGHVVTMPAEELCRRLTRTYEWLLRHRAGPTTHPSGSAREGE